MVADVHHAALDAPTQPTIYVPYGQDPWASVTVVLKASVPPADVAAAARAAIWQVDKDQPIGAVRTMSEQMAVSMARRRFSVSLLTAFGTLAAALAAIGLYGVLAFLVSERRREIGVRMALGARPVDVIAGVMRQGLHLAAIGLAIGLPLAAGATRQSGRPAHLSRRDRAARARDGDGQPRTGAASQPRRSDCRVA